MKPSEVIRQGNQAWYSPDDLFSRPEFITFLYGKVWGTNIGFVYKDDCHSYNKWDRCEHWSVILHHFRELGWDVDRDEEKLKRTDLMREALVGRTDKEDVAFWNRDLDLYDQLLIPCLRELLGHGFCDYDSFVSTPRGSVHVEDLMPKIAPQKTYARAMYQQRFDPEVRKYWTPESLNFKGWLYKG